MTAIWGPLGWMTLHSISVCYPDNPTDSDKAILNQFMTAYGTTISCPSCNNHFAQTFFNYKSRRPQWNSSKYELFLAFCRIHNGVNRRIDKPSPATVSECLQTLKNATQHTSQSEFRSRYLDYLTSNWRQQNPGVVGIVNQMRKIDNEYWSIREVSYASLSFPESDVFEITRQESGIDRRAKVMFRNGKFIRVR
jgi:hypothetical protein